MQAAPLATHQSGAAAKLTVPYFNGRPDYDFAAALTKVSPQVQAKAKATAQDFEAIFLNSMFSHMTNGLNGEGPFGNTVGTGVWRSLLTEQYSKSFAKAGGIGISNEVYRTLILQQAGRVNQAQGKQA
jgi:peptidoglycan hydrolase FlgJ